VHNNIIKCANIFLVIREKSIFLDIYALKVKEDFMIADDTLSVLFKSYDLRVPQDAAPTRVDIYIHDSLNLYSRTFIQRLINESKVLVNGKPVKASTLVVPSDSILISIEPEKPFYSPTFSLQEEEYLTQLEIKVLYEDDDFLVVNKPANLMVHKPSPYCTALTLVDWLYKYFSECIKVGHPERPGIVHRLDKETSGLMIVARTNVAHQHFSTMFKTRAIKKEYKAIVHGHCAPSGIIHLPIGRNPIKRNQMTIHGIEPRDSLTRYEVVRYYDAYTLVDVYPETGRTHQIRVHFKALGHPLIGDTTYGTQSSLIERHALHASTISFNFKGRPFTFHAPLPADMERLLTIKQPLHKPSTSL
jgi:23S rRNA pseudouridine1911/1915/1917 synthase